MNPLVDKQFLKQLDLNRDREVFARILSLSWDEHPQDLIEGRVTAGSVNIDGASAVRRTCSLTIVANDLEEEINSYYWGLKSKFKLEIGLKNTIKEDFIDEKEEEIWGDRYPQDIIWFPQGLYIITGFNTSQSTNSYTISISGKDKMCLLNGDISGSISAQTDFGVLEEVDLITNTTTYIDIPIKQILKEAVHVYANEPYHNIILNDLDEVAVELLEYRGDTPLYMLRDVNQNEFVNFTLKDDMECIGYDDGQIYSISNKSDYPELIYDQRIANLDAGVGAAATEVRFESDTTNTKYTIAKVEYGDTAGYRYTELTYAGELIGNVGESITSIFDKIKNMLGEYEYFYDLDGRFIFQKKKVYVNTSWNNIVKVGDEQYADSAAYTSSFIYSFEDGVLITSFQNTPNLNNLRNDFSVWGVRTSISGVDLPIHYRYAIDEKPEYYCTIEGKAYCTKQYDQDRMPAAAGDPVIVDWRELIYQMALDYYKNNQEEDFTYQVAAANRQSGDYPNLYATGTTGYEQYYTDIQGFWRELYNPFLTEDDDKYDEYYQISDKDIYEPYWNKMVAESPASLNFWFDFLDAKDSQEDNNVSELNQYSVPAVGDRLKAVNDKDVKSIYFKEVPNIIFTTRDDWGNMIELKQSGYTPVLTQSNLESLFSISSQGKSAKDALDELLYNYSYCIESVNISAIPIYYLEPNARIYVRDDKSKINGEYIVSKITLPLTYNGTMQITATKAPERIL